MGDKLFFGEIEKQSKAAEAAYMATRGKHTSDKDTAKKIDVAGVPGVFPGDNNDSGGK